MLRGRFKSGGSDSGILTKFLVVEADVRRWTTADVVQECELPNRLGVRRYKLLRESPADPRVRRGFVIVRYEPNGSRYISAVRWDQGEAEQLLARVISGRQV